MCVCQSVTHVLSPNCNPCLAPIPTPALSPSEGARENHRQSLVFPLAPAEGERVGVRGRIGGGVEIPPSLRGAPASGISLG